MGTLHNLHDPSMPSGPSNSADDILKRGGGNGGGDDMFERVKALEEKMSSMVVDVAILKETVATKEVLHKELNSQTWKIVVALVIAVAMAVLSKYFLK